MHPGELWRRGRLALRQPLRYALTGTGAAGRHGEGERELQRHVDAVRGSLWQLSDLEYGLVLGLLLARAPANLLVFGLGADAPLWAGANRAGRTLFLEDRAEWLADVPGAETCLVSCPGVELPPAARDVRWDVVLVDGPMAWRPGHPGRGAAIRLAAAVAGPGAWVVVHDYDRPAERACCDEVLGRPLQAVDRTALFRPGAA